MGNFVVGRGSNAADIERVEELIGDSHSYEREERSTKINLKKSAGFVFCQKCRNNGIFFS